MELVAAIDSTLLLISWEDLYVESVPVKFIQLPAGEIPKLRSG